MGALDRIINIQIDRQTRAVSQAGFGTALILFEQDEAPNDMTELTRTYSDLDALADDFPSTTEVYKAAEAYFGQSLKPEKVMVGRRDYTGDWEVQEVEFSAVPDEGSFRLAYGSEQTSLLAFGATAAQVQAALRLLPGLEAVTVTGNFAMGFVVTFVNVLGNPDQLTNANNTLEASNVAVVITHTTTTPGTAVSRPVADALNAINDENSDFYAVGMISSVQADQEALAAWLATQRRIGGVRTSDAGALTTGLTDIAAVLNAAQRERTFVIYTSDSDLYPEFAWLGRMLPELPGSATFKVKTLSGITPDNLTDTQITNLRNKKANYYTTVGGVNITEEGWMASGEFIDVIIGVDFIHARMQESIYSRLVNLKKVPYTNQGVDIIVNEMEGVLTRAVNQGILAADPAPTVTKPNVREIPFNDRALRQLPDLFFNGVLAGAIHRVLIRGTVTV